MIVIAERINATRKRIGKAVADRDAAFIAREAKLQADAGATHIDCNAGRNPAKEIEDLQWMIGVVQDSVDLPICIDSANAQAIAAALKRVRKMPMINSVTAEKARLEQILPLAREHQALLVGLCMGDSGMPEGAADRIRAAEQVRDAAAQAGIAVDRIYFDPVIVPASTKATEASRRDRGGAAHHEGVRRRAHDLRPEQHLLRAAEPQHAQPHVPGDAHGRRPRRRHHGPDRAAHDVHRPRRRAPSSAGTSGAWITSARDGLRSWIRSSYSSSSSSSSSVSERPFEDEDEDDDEDDR